MAGREGVRLWTQRGRIRASPAGRASAPLRRAVVSAKPQLLSVLPPAPPKFGLEPGRCFDCGADLPDTTIIGICFPCRRERNPNAERIEDDAEDRSAPEDSLRVIVESKNPLPGPIQVAPWCQIEDPAKCIDGSLPRLEHLVALYSGACRDPDRQDEAGEIGDSIEELVERLALCGARVVISSVQ